MNKFKQLIINTIIFAIGNVLTKMILFLLMPLYTSVLTTEQYGTVDLLTNSIELILPICTLCISDAVFRFSIDEQSDYEKIFTNGVSIVIKSNIIFIIGVCFIGIFLKQQYLILFTSMYVLNSICQLFSQFTRGIGKAKVYTVSGIINALTLAVSNLILLKYLSIGIKGYLISIIISNLATILYLVLKIKLFNYINFNKLDKKLLKSMLLFSIPNVPNMLSWWVNNISSRYIINLYCGAAIAGLFASASKIPALVNVLASVFQQAWQYSSTREYGRKDSEKFYSDVFKYYSIFINITVSALLLALPYICRFVLKGEFYVAWKYAPLLLVSATLGCYSIYFGTFYVVVKKNIWAMISTITGAIVNLINCFILIPKIGVYGALISSVSTYMIITIIRIITTRKYVKIEVNYINLVSSIIILLIQAILSTVNNEKTKLFQIFIFIILIMSNGKNFFAIFKVLLINKRKLLHEKNN